MDISSRQKTSKETQALNNILDIINTYRAFHPKAVDYTFSSSTHRTFSRTHHKLGVKSKPGKFKNTGIISTIFF